MGPYAIIQCTCGAAIGRCRCLAPHTVDVREQGCPRCAPAEAELWRLAHEDYQRLWSWLRAHFPGFLAQQGQDVPGSEVIIALLTQYMQHDDAGTLRGHAPTEAPYY